MERNILSWNITNWITILLMVGIGFVVIGAAVSLGRQYMGGSSPTSAAQTGNMETSS